MDHYQNKNSAKATSDKQIIDKLLDFIMRDKNIIDKEKLLEALMSDDFEFEEKFRLSKYFKKGKDSLLMDSDLYNHHSTSYKEIRHEDSLNNEVHGYDSNKINMTEDFDKIQSNEKKKEKDRKFIGKLIDRPSTNSKKIRPKSSKGIRNNVKTTSVATTVLNQKNTKLNQKGSDYLNSNIQGNQLRGKQGRSK